MIGYRVCEIGAALRHKGRVRIMQRDEDNTGCFLERQVCNGETILQRIDVKQHVLTMFS